MCLTRPGATVSLQTKGGEDMPETLIKMVSARVDPDLAWRAKQSAIFQRIFLNEWICRAIEEKLARDTPVERAA